MGALLSRGQDNDPRSLVSTDRLVPGHIDFLCPGRDPGTIDRASQRMKVALFALSFLVFKCLCY